MAKETTPNPTPNPVVTPTPAPAPAPAATPAPVAASAASAATVRDTKGRFTKPVSRPDPNKIRLSAAKALGLSESPATSAEAAVKSARKRYEHDSPVTEAIFKPVEEEETEAAPVEAPAVEAPAPAATAPVAEPQKVKIGEKEFTAEQLAAQLKELEELKARAAAPSPEPEPEPEPAAAAAPEVTPEQIAQREKDFLKSTVEALDAPLTEQEVDTLLAGGAEAVKLLQSIRKQDMARAILEARKGIAAGLNPVMQSLFSNISPLVQHHEQLRAQLVEQHFLSKHGDFAPFVDKARSVAQELWKRFPQQVSKMSADQFCAEVARQTGTILDREWKSFHPNDSTSWRDVAKAAAATPAAAAAVAAAVAPAPAAVAAPATPAVPKKPAVKPPVANPPVGGSFSGTPGGWQKGVAASLR